MLDTVGFFANIMHPLEELKPFAFRVLEIRHAHGGLVLRGGGAGQEKGWRGRLRGLEKGLKELSGVGKFWRRRVKRREGERGGDGEKGGRRDRKGHTVHFAVGDDPERGVASTSAVETSTSTKAPTSPTSPTSPLPSSPPPPGAPPRRTPTMSERFTDVLTNPTMVNSEERYTVPPAYNSPVHLVSIFSFLLTIGIVVAAGFWEDGTAIVAICLISLASTVVCYASWWRPILMNRRTTNKVPKGDVVIRTREGAFLLIKCTEEVARELYSGTEECRYVSTKYHRVFMGLGMVLLMVAVVLLGNCSWNSQVFIGGSYILLNGLYWVLGLLPQESFWDLSRYDVQEVTPADALRADETTDPDDPREGTPSFTRTLWYAIRETKHGAWVERSGAMPVTDQWKLWLNEAVAAAWKGDRKWEAVRRKNDIMKEALDASSPTSLKHPFDQAEQRAPLLEVQPPRRRDTQGQGSSTF